MYISLSLSIYTSLSPRQSKRTEKARHNMKLLNWMRVKIKQTNTNPLTEFVTGNYGCLSSDTCSATKQNLKLVSSLNHVYQNSFSETERYEAKEKLEEDDDDISFHGFLAIGTLGAEPPATPKLFDAPVEEEDGSQEKNKEDITKHELKLICDKLEKFLESEAEEGYNGSIIQIKDQNLPGLGEFSDTASFKAGGSNGEEEYGETVLCPLQGYLLGSSVEIVKTYDGVEKKKGFIAELFQRKKSAEKVSFTEKHEHIRRDSIKKMMLRKLHGWSPKKSFTPCGKDDDPVPRKKKLKKIGRILRRKIHPIICTAETEENEPNKDHEIDVMFRNKSYINGGHIYRHGGDNEVWSSSEGFLSSESGSEMPQYEVVGKIPKGKREKWIKTDSEFLVLEL